VDLTAHLGGGVVGFVLGAVAFYPDPGLPTDAPKRLARGSARRIADRLYSLGAVLASLALAAAVAVALDKGRPWRFVRAPLLHRVSIGSSGLSFELPEPLDSEPLPTAEPSEGWRFGVPARSPLAVRVVLLDDSLPPLDPEREQQPQIERRLTELHDQIEREPSDADLPRTALELDTFEGRRMLRDEYRGPEQQTVRYFLYVGALPVALVVWRFRSWRSDLWPGVDRRIAASLRADSGSVSR
jgi:hypothetical protein